MAHRHRSPLEGQRTDLADSHLQEAVLAHRAGRLQDALRGYERVLAVKPDHAAAFNFAGVASFQAGDPSAAIKLLHTAVTLDPGSEESFLNLGNVLQKTGDQEAAEAAFRRALQIRPDYAEAFYSLGLTLQARGKPDAAEAAFRSAIHIRPDYYDALLNLSAVLQEFGRLEEALEASRRAISLRPEDPAAHNNAALALRAIGRDGEAIRALTKTVEIKPSYALAHYNLGQLLYRQADPEPAACAFERALRADPALFMAQFYLGVIREQQRDDRAAAHHFAELARCRREYQHLLDSWHYAKKQSGPDTRFGGNAFETLGHAFDQAPGQGLVLEFGVRFGTSINFIAQRTDRLVHGFDSFQGLPERWEGYQAGTYTTGGILPEVAPNVRLHAGWFSETLPPFVAEHGEPVSFLNVDCDLYSSTKTIFEHLADRIGAGTVIAFDEYLINPAWRDHEFKAFHEAVAENGWRYEYLEFNLFTKQAVARIL